MDWKALFGKAKTTAEEGQDALVEGAAKNPKRFVNIVAGVVVVLLILLGVAYCTKARATEVEVMHHGWKHLHHVVKPPIVPPVVPPVVVPPVVVPPVAPPAAAPTAPATQAGPATGSASPWPGYIAIAGVAIYFSAAIYTHWIFCAEDDKKKKEDRVCFRPLRDGMP